MLNRSSYIISVGFILIFLVGCQSRPYLPPDTRQVQDQWEVHVARDGLVQIERHVLIDEEVSAYIRGSSALDRVKLFGEMDNQAMSNCEAPKTSGGAIAVECSAAYPIPAMPTALSATLIFPEDLLLGFLLDALAYQPVALSVVQQVHVIVPGRINLSKEETTDLFPVYASQSIEESLLGPSHLQLDRSVILSPGDLVQPAMQHLTPIEFEPVLGMP